MFYHTVYSLVSSFDFDSSIGKGCPDIPSIDIPDNYISRLVSFIIIEYSYSLNSSLDKGCLDILSVGTHNNLRRELYIS